MKFTTVSGSVYEVNFDSKKIRRLNGVKDSTSRQGKDGEWRAYKELIPSPLKKGVSAVIIWKDDTELLDETIVEDGMIAIPTTRTSTVVEIEL